MVEPSSVVSVRDFLWLWKYCYFSCEFILNRQTRASNVHPAYKYNAYFMNAWASQNILVLWYDKNVFYSNILGHGGRRDQTGPLIICFLKATLGKVKANLTRGSQTIQLWDGWRWISMPILVDLFWTFCFCVSFLFHHRQSHECLHQEPKIRT